MKKTQNTNTNTKSTHSEMVPLWQCPPDPMVELKRSPDSLELGINEGRGEWRGERKKIRKERERKEEKGKVCTHINFHKLAPMACSMVFNE